MQAQLRPRLLDRQSQVNTSQQALRAFAALCFPNPAFFSGNASALAQTLVFSIQQADSAYAASHSSGPGPDIIVRSAPYRPYNHTAAAQRAAVLGQGIAQAQISDAIQAEAYARAFTLSFLQQTSPFQGLYGGFTVATQTLLAAQAANQTSAYRQMFAQAS